MPLRNQNWYNSHASRRYPLDDKATGTGDDGSRLNDDIIVDLHLRWPQSAGQYAYVGGVTVTQNIVTVIILAADSPTAAGAPTPLAAVTVAQPVARHRYYNVEPLYPGVGGFIAFGDPAETFSIRFSTPQQGLLASKVGRPYASLPIPTMRKLGRVDGLTGLVKILGGRDVEVVKEQVSYDGIDRDALVIRLTAPTRNDNVLLEYSGPCAARPESRNCRKEGVETINGIGPDCDGNIEIDFRHFKQGPYESCGADEAGTTLDQAIGIDEVCADRSPGKFTGQDYCAPIESSSSESSESLSEASLSSSSESSDSLSSEVQTCAELPFLDRFNEVLHQSWVAKIGSYNFVADDSPFQPTVLEDVCFSSVSSSVSSSYLCDEAPEASVQLTDSSRRQVLAWEDCAVGNSLGKRITTHMRLTNQAARINGGLVINHRLVDPFTNPHIEYFLFSLNRNNNRVELLRFNGSTFITENAVAPPTPFSLNDWFELEVLPTSLGSGSVALAVRVTNVTNPSWGTVQFAVATTRYGDGTDGFHGIGNNRAVTRFSYWMLEDA